MGKRNRYRDKEKLNKRRMLDETETNTQTDREN